MTRTLVKRVQLRGRQEGLVLTITSSDCIVHWPKLTLREGSTQLLETTTLPFQQGAPLYELNDNTEINSTQEVMVIRQPLVPPTPPDIHSSDEGEPNISPNMEAPENESEAQRIARLKKNKMRDGRRHRAHQRKEAWNEYEAKVHEYSKQVRQREEEEEEEKERRAAERLSDSPYEKIKKMIEELEGLAHPTEEQERRREILRATAARL